jgi:hypothetical protein
MLLQHLQDLQLPQGPAGSLHAAAVNVHSNFIWSMGTRHVRCIEAFCMEIHAWQSLHNSSTVL